ncbi:MAG TPA: type II toxin-antitoxin system RelE/ParE family toxin [Spirochaetota bacterium]|jgi:proteic killer suppression protein|nr:type II toxin-antitoxin system RelE/ParE family toxin [Spirochaetota bacterium]
MKIGFASQKLQKIFNSEKELKKAYGDQSSKIKIRMKVLESAVNLEEVPHQKPERRHQLKGDRKNQFAVDLIQPYRLVFEPDSQIEFLSDGGIDLKQVTGIIILGVEDYHGN